MRLSLTGPRAVVRVDTRGLAPRGQQAPTPSSSAALVAVMEAADFRYGDHAAVIHDRTRKSACPSRAIGGFAIVRNTGGKPAIRGAAPIHSPRGRGRGIPVGWTQRNALRRRSAREHPGRSALRESRLPSLWCRVDQRRDRDRESGIVAPSRTGTPRGVAVRVVSENSENPADHWRRLGAVIPFLSAPEFRHPPSPASSKLRLVSASGSACVTRLSDAP